MPFQAGIIIVAFSSWDYGYALLKEAGIYDSAGKPVKQREVRKQKLFCREKKSFSIFQLGVAGLDLKVGQKYTVKVELVAKKVNKLKKREIPKQSKCNILLPEGNPIGSLLFIKIPRTILSAPCPSSWESSSLRTTPLPTPEPKGLSRLER